MSRCERRIATSHQAGAAAGRILPESLEVDHTYRSGRPGSRLLEPAVVVDQDPERDDPGGLIERQDLHLGVLGNAEIGAGDPAPHHVALPHGDRHRGIGDVPVAGGHGDGLEALSPRQKPGLYGVGGVDAQRGPGQENVLYRRSRHCRQSRNRPRDRCAPAAALAPNTRSAWRPECRPGPKACRCARRSRSWRRASRSSRCRRCRPGRATGKSGEVVALSGKVKPRAKRGQPEAGGDLNPASFLDFAPSDSYVAPNFFLRPGANRMASLGEVVRGLAARDGVEAVLVLSADGLPIEHAAREPFEAETAGRPHRNPGAVRHPTRSRRRHEARSAPRCSSTSADSWWWPRSAPATAWRFWPSRTRTSASCSTICANTARRWRRRCSG